MNDHTIIAEYNLTRAVMILLVPLFIIGLRVATLMAAGNQLVIPDLLGDLDLFKILKLAVTPAAISVYYLVFIKDIKRAIFGKNGAVILESENIIVHGEQKVSLRDIEKTSYGTGVWGPYFSIHYRPNNKILLKTAFLKGGASALVAKIGTLMPGLPIEKL